MRHCEHTHDDPAGLAGARLTSALADAETRCAQSRERLTPPRRRALELLLKSGRPLKAYDLIGMFDRDGAPAKPPTVYRALEFLTRQGFAHRVESLNAYVACRAGGEAHVAAFLVCTCCGDTREIGPFEPKNCIAAARAADFSLADVVIEARGLCSACAADRA